MSLFDELLKLEEEETRANSAGQKPAAPSKNMTQAQRPVSAQKPAASAQRPAVTAQKPSPMQARVTTNIQTSVKSSMTSSYKGASEGMPPDAHEHPAYKSPGAAIEKVDYVQYGTEGCQAHYNERIVSPDAVMNAVSSMNPAQYINALVLGEVLCNPRFRSPWRKK